MFTSMESSIWSLINLLMHRCLSSKVLFYVSEDKFNVVEVWIQWHCKDNFDLMADQPLFNWEWSVHRSIIHDQSNPLRSDTIHEIRDALGKKVIYDHWSHIPFNKPKGYHFIFSYQHHQISQIIWEFFLHSCGSQRRRPNSLLKAWFWNRCDIEKEKLFLLVKILLNKRI